MMEIMWNPARVAAVSFLVATACACGSRPAGLVPPAGQADLADAAAPFPRVRLGDGTLTGNDHCPVTKRKLSPAFPPVYVNGMPIGFC